MEKRGFFQNINFLEKTRLEKNIFFWKKLNPFFHSFFKKKHLFLFFSVRPGAESEKTPMYMYMYIFIYIGFRLFIVLRTKKRQNHRVPSLYEGPRPGLYILGKFSKKNFLEISETQFFLKIQIFLETVSWKLEKSRSLKISKFKIPKRDVARELEKENERLSPSKGGQRTHFCPITPFFSM